MKKIHRNLGVLGLVLVPTFAFSAILLSDRQTRHFALHRSDAPVVGGASGTRSIMIEPVGGGPISTVSVPIDKPGDTELLPDKSLLVSGCDTQSNPIRGVVALLRADQSGLYTVRSTYTEPNADFSGVCYEPLTGLIFIFDSANARIHKSVYPGGDFLPQTWGPFTDSSQVPELVYAKEYALRMGESDLGAKVLVLEHYDPSLGLGLDAYELPLLGPITADVRKGMWRSAQFVGDRLEVDQTQVPVTGPPSTFVYVVQMSNGQAVGLAYTDSEGKGVAQTSPLQMGEVYVARTSVSDSELDIGYKSPTLHWNTPEPLPGGASMEPFGSSLALRAYVNSKHFAVRLRVSDPNLAHSGASYLTRLVVGLPGNIIPFGNTQLLQSPFYVTTSTRFRSNGKGGWVRVPIPIPNDPLLAGSLISFQWWVATSDTDLSISDIVRVAVRAQPWIPLGSEGMFAEQAQASTAESRLATQPIGSVAPKSSLSNFLKAAGAEADYDLYFKTADMIKSREKKKK